MSVFPLACNRSTVIQATLVKVAGIFGIQTISKHLCNITIFKVTNLVHIMCVLEELYLAFLQYLTMDSKAINQLYESSTLRDGNYHVVPQLICNYEVAKMFSGPNVPLDRLPYHHSQNDHHARA